MKLHSKASKFAIQAKVCLSRVAIWRDTSLTAPKLALLLALTGASANAATLELQGQCAAQARKMFELDGLAGKPTAAYVNHYDEKSNKCFVAIQETRMDGDTVWTSETVLDAFEGIDYANYMWRSEKNKKYREIPPLVCSIKTPAGDKTECRSDDEFDELIHRNFGLTFK